MKSKSDIIDMMECKHCRNGHLFLSRIWWSTVRNPNHAHSPFASLLLHTGQGESADDSSKLKNQKSRLDRLVSAIFSAFASALCQKMLSLKMSWHLKVFNDSDGKLFRLTSFCAGPQGHQQRIGRRDVSVMCQYVSLRASWCRVKKHFISFHLMPFDKLIDVTWCHLMHQVSLVNAPTGSASLRNPLKVATISSNAWGQHLTDLGLSHFFQGEDELFETGWMCNLFYLYGSELTYRHLCASLLSAPSAVGLVGPVGWSGSCVFMHNLAPMSAESIWEFVGCRMRLESVGWPRTLGHDVTQNLADSGELCNKTCMTFVQIYETCLEIASFSHCSYCSPSFYCLWYFWKGENQI